MIIDCLYYCIEYCYVYVKNNLGDEPIYCDMNTTYLNQWGTFI